MKRRSPKHKKIITNVYAVYINGQITHPSYTTRAAAAEAIKWREERERKYLNATIRPQRVAMWTD